jgi:DNA-binding LacI/PurR family transcriptional regulator
MLNLHELNIDRNSYNSVGSQIAEYFKGKIQCQDLIPGEKLPTSRQMMAEVGVSSITIKKAISKLVKEGLVKATNRGTFVRTDVFCASEKEKRGNFPPKSKDYAYIVSNLQSYHYNQILEGGNNYLGKKHISSGFVVFTTNDNIDKQSSAVVQILDRQMPGVVIIPPIRPKVPVEQIRVLQSNGVPVVFAIRKPSGVKAPVVTWDWESVGVEVGRRLVHYGHKLVAYIGAVRYSMANTYESSLRVYLESHGASLPEEYVYYGEKPATNADSALEDISCDKYLFIKKILSGKNPPTAIFCNDGYSEEIIYLCATHLGISIPGELSIVRFGEEKHNSSIANRMDSATVDFLKMGETVISIISEIQENERSIYDDEVVKLPLIWKKGATLSRSS